MPVEATRLCAFCMLKGFSNGAPLPQLLQDSQETVTSTIKLSSRATSEFWEIQVLYEDEHLLALDKPSGLLTSPDRYDPERPNLMKLLHAAIAESKPWAKERSLTYLMNAHRLDFETSGIILLAKSKPVLEIGRASC